MHIDASAFLPQDDEADGFGNTRIASIFEDRAGELAGAVGGLKHVLSLGPSTVGEDIHFR